MSKSGIAGAYPQSQFGLIVVAAPSGAGKSTLCTHLLKDLNSRLALSISSTSRAPRGQEQNGKEYYFLSAEEFKRKIDAGEFAEWARVHGNYYGTSKETLHQFWNQKKHVLLDIDVQGAASLKLAFPERTYGVFIAPPSMEELERRLRTRGTDSDEVIEKRLQNSVAEIARKHEFNEVIVNDQYDSAYQTLYQKVIAVMDAWEKGTHI